MKLVASKSNPPLCGLIVFCAVKGKDVSVEWGNETELIIDSETKLTSNASICRYLAQLPGQNLYGNDIMQKCEIDHWLSFASGPLAFNRVFNDCIMYLENCLAPVTYLVGRNCSIADFAVWSALYVKPEWNLLLKQGEVPDNLMRWYSLIESNVVVSKATELYSKNIKLEESGLESLRKEDGKFINLPDAKMGEVVVRFPPEASGYLHIGHAKAALLNQYYKEAFKGKLIMRFDDTNPAKEKVDFEKVILEDLKLLQITPDVFTHTSDYFDIMLEMCENLLKQGHAYVDDTDPETMKTEREQRIESRNRSNSVEKNLNLWDEMKKGTITGQKCCVRAKINMTSDNGCMRDPTIYRCKNELHPKTGDKYKVYPTYDFACPIVDSIEGVTHCLRTMEYHDRDEQFYWFIDTLGLRKPHIWEYSRLNMTNTVLSKRKLTWFVENGYVNGWDDPRFPTVRGVLRRGMTVEGLKQFVVAQGSSRSVVVMEWDKIWAFNKKVIDPIAPRYTAVESLNKVSVNIVGALEESINVPKHPKNQDVGEKTIWLGPKIIVDEVDANEFKEGENVTFINWGNMKIVKINRENGKISEIIAEPNLDNKDYKKTMKVTWLAETSKERLIPCICVYFQHIISKPVLGKDEDFKQYIDHCTMVEVPMLGDPELSKIKKSDIIQIQRKGFFICDSSYQPPSIYTGRESPVILYSIPDGHSKQVFPGEIIKNQVEQKEKQNKECIKSQSDIFSINNEIKIQGDLIRQLKQQKVEKAVLDPEIKKLLKLKETYKSISGQDWQPNNQMTPPSVTKESNISTNISESEISLKIVDVGNKIRILKAEKADKNVIAEEVKVLLDLKSSYKNITGMDWKPESTLGGSNKGDVKENVDKKLDNSKTDSIALLTRQIKETGDLIRQLKSTGASKEEINANVQKLLTLKNEYKTISGVDFPTEGKKSNSKEENKSKEKKKETKSTVKSEKIVKTEENQSVVKKVTRLGLEAKKEDNLADWYSQIIVKGEMIEYYDVSGCYILRPWSYGIWEEIKGWLDAEIKKLGVKNCYFPMFVSKSVLEKEKTHIEDFAPEVAWVTKSGDSDLAEPIAVRPTSETVMYPAYAKWIQSHRDLPLKLNQWNNVVRWEFKHPQPFLRTREFLWQEGHTAFAQATEAIDEVNAVLDLYAKVYTDLLAIPVIKGRKTEKEKFAGADFTLTVEAFISASGRAIQGATSHHLGQNFSKMFEIIFEDPDTQEKKFVFQNSWGMTTRTIGVLVMVHGDNQGLVLPPRVAAIQVVIVPCGITANLPQSEKDALLNVCNSIQQRLSDIGIRVHGDYRDNYSPGWKFNHWELKGVPVRMEIGPKDLKQNQVLTIRRDNGIKETFKIEEVDSKIELLLNNIQVDMLKRTSEELNKHIVTCHQWNDFCQNLDSKNIILSPFCGEIPCEETIKKNSARVEMEDSNAPSMGAKSLCIPLEQPKCGIVATDKCINPECSLKPKFYTLFGRSY